MGINMDGPNQKNHFNKSIYVYISLATLSLIQSGAFLIFQANTFDEYTEGSYILSACILSPLAIGSIIFKIQTFFRLIEICEDTFNASEWKTIENFWGKKPNSINYEQLLSRVVTYSQNRIITEHVPSAVCDIGALVTQLY